MDKFIYCVKVMLAIVSVLVGVYAVYVSSSWLMWSLIGLFLVNLVLPDTIYEASALFVSACVSVILLSYGELTWAMMFLVIELVVIASLLYKYHRNNLERQKADLYRDEDNRDYNEDEDYISGDILGMVINFVWCAVVLISSIAK